MCDYSLHAVASRPARSGDTLITSGFPGTISRGFIGKDDCTTAVCLRPGTEIAFHHEPKRDGPIAALLNYFGYRQIGSRVATFRKLHEDRPTHHDALEFANGTIVYVHALREGQHAIVLQLPIGDTEAPAEELAHTLSRSLADV
jgi:hypothetical protein